MQSKFVTSLCFPSLPPLLRFLGPVTTKDMQTPLPLRSGYLDIEDTQCAENKDGPEISYHITSRLGVTGVQKGRFGRPEIHFSLKVAKFAG